jgi:hypothetical protein
MLRWRVVGGYVVVLAAVFASALLVHARRNGERYVSAPVPLYVPPDPAAELAAFESGNAVRGLPPLSQSCKVGSDRLRYQVMSCAGSAVLEIDLRDGGVRASADGMTLLFDGAPFAAGYVLPPSRRAALTNLLQHRLPALQPVVDAWVTPAYFTGIEACLAGKSFTSIRRASDERYEGIATQLLAGAAIVIRPKRASVCL